MIRCYCDRCGKEIDRTNKISIPKQKTTYGFETVEKEVCSECEEVFNDIISKLVDIRFILFEGFFEGFTDKYKTEGNPNE